MDSGLRKISILSKLSRYRKISTTEIKTHLETEGINVTLRTIQRDLVELSQIFPVICDDSKPMGWQLERGAELTVPNFDLTTSITFILLDKYLSNLLPQDMLERLQPFVKTARSFLREDKQISEAKWPSKIALAGKGLPLITGSIDDGIISTLYSATLHEHQIEIEYDSMTSGEIKAFLFHPHAIIVRDERLYLIGRYDNYDDIRQIAFHRITSATELTKKANIKPDFNLKSFMATGKHNVIRNDDFLNIELWGTPVLAKLLNETPLSKEQIITPFENDYKITAKVEDSDELRHWLLSMSSHATVLSPESLRQEIKEILANALSYY